jgi:hypothetical protein
VRAELTKRLTALEMDAKHSGFTGVPNYTDEQRARLVVHVFHEHGNSTDPEVVWRLGRITEILEEGRRRQHESTGATN